MVAVLGQSFWEKLSQISHSVGMEPEDLMAVMYYESGLDPAARNKNGNASGLIQFMPDTLDKMGFRGGDQQFRQLDADKQLDWVAQYVSSRSGAVGGHFKSATQYYVANLWPIALKLPGVQNEDPSTIILEENPITSKYPGISAGQERAAYQANRGLDVSHDGKITYGDLDAVMQGVKRSKGFQHALATLENGGELAVGKGAPSSSNPSSNEPATDKLTQIEQMLGSLWKAVAQKELGGKFLLKQAYRQHLLPNQMLIKIATAKDDLISSIEFARILCLALEEEMAAEAFTCTDGSEAEVSCIIHGARQLSVQAAVQLCSAVSEAFETMTGNTITATIHPNQKPRYQSSALLWQKNAMTTFTGDFKMDTNESEHQFISAINELNLAGKQITFAELIAKVWGGKVVEIYIGDTFEDLSLEETTQKVAAVCIGRVITAYAECIVLDCAYVDQRTKTAKFGNIVCLNERGIRTITEVDDKGMLKDTFLSSRDSKMVKSLMNKA